MRIYISGPMTGYKDLNKMAFFAADNFLTQKGHYPVNPVIIGDILLYDTAEILKRKPTYMEYIKADLNELMECKGIYLLKGWFWSKGARMEWLVAKFFRLKVYHERNYT